MVSRKYKAGFATAQADIKRKGVEYAARVPRPGDHRAWAAGYRAALADAKSVTCR